LTSWGGTPAPEGPAAFLPVIRGRSPPACRAVSYLKTGCKQGIMLLGRIGLPFHHSGNSGSARYGQTRRKAGTQSYGPISILDFRLWILDCPAKSRAPAREAFAGP